MAGYEGNMMLYREPHDIPRRQLDLRPGDTGEFIEIGEDRKQRVVGTVTVTSVVRNPIAGKETVQFGRRAE